MRLLFNLFSIFPLASRPAVRPLLAVSFDIIGAAERSQMWDDMYYGMYALQNCGPTHTVEYKGKKGFTIYYDISGKNHENFPNFTGISVKLSVPHMRHFSVQNHTPKYGLGSQRNFFILTEF